jgi:hypothetical protein
MNNPNVSIYETKLVVHNDYGVIKFNKNGVAYLQHLDETGKILYRVSINKNTPTSFVPCSAGKVKEIRAEYYPTVVYTIWKHGQPSDVTVYYYKSGEMIPLPKINYHNPLRIHHYGMMETKIMLHFVSTHQITGCLKPMNFKREDLGVEKEHPSIFDHLDEEDDYEADLFASKLMRLEKELSTNVK